MEDEMEMFFDIAAKIMNDTPQLSIFFRVMGEAAINGHEFDKPIDIYKYGALLGFAKAIHDIQKGYLNLKIIEIERKEPHGNEESDNPLLRRNKATGHGENGQVDGL
jgi:hypothetical protein